MEFLIKLVELPRLRTAGGSRLPELRVQCFQIRRYALTLIINELGSTTRCETLELADYLQQLPYIVARQRCHGHARLLSWRRYYVPLALESLKSSAHRRPADAESLGNLGLDNSCSRSELAANDHVAQRIVQSVCPLRRTSRSALLTFLGSLPGGSFRHG